MGSEKPFLKKESRQTVSPLLSCPLHPFTVFSKLLPLLFCFGWILSPLMLLASTWLGCPTFGGPCMGSLCLPKALPRFFRNLARLSLSEMTLVLLGGTDDLWQRLLLGEALKPQRVGSERGSWTTLAQKGEGFPFLSFRGIHFSFSFLFFGSLAT